MWIASPRAYAALAFGDETDSTDGALVSTRMAPRPPSSPPVAGSGRDRLAAGLPARSVIVSSPSDRAPAPAYPKSAALSPASTAYANDRFLPALPPASYLPNRSPAASSSLSAIDGSVPPRASTFTSSSNETVIWITEPGPYAPLAFGDETDTARGATVSGTIALAWASEPGERGSGSPKSTALPSASVTAPLDVRAPACA